MTTKPTGTTPKPFADDEASFDLAGLTVENGTEAIAVYGQVDLTKDKAGLARARTILTFMQAVVTVLEGESALPDSVPPPKKAKAVKNPFS